MARASVLIIDESDLFRDYLRSRLSRAGMDVAVAINGLDGMAKMRNDPPGIIILDYHLTRRTCKEVLEEKAKNPNTANIPIILTAHKIDKNKLLELVPFNIKKIFTKPIKMDAFYQTISEITGIRFEMDTTPCIIEAHVNDNIVFVEIAQGINREKVDLLRFKIRELEELYSIQKPRILLMLSDMDLSFIDGPNLEFLMETILASTDAKSRHIKILTRSTFIREFVAGHPGYEEIEVVSSLEYAIDGLIAAETNAVDAPEEKAAIINDRILSAKGSASQSEAIAMRFQTEKKEQPRLSMENANDLGRGLSIATVDDDFVIQELLKTTFAAMNADVSTYPNGKEFLTAIRSRSFDLVFLDLLMPEVDGFQVLSELHAQDIDVPIIILSAVSQREAIVRAFQSGVKSFLIKPLKPEQILKKTLEILKANF